MNDEFHASNSALNSWSHVPGMDDLRTLSLPENSFCNGIRLTDDDNKLVLKSGMGVFGIASFACAAAIGFGGYLFVMGGPAGLGQRDWIALLSAICLAGGAGIVYWLLFANSGGPGVLLSICKLTGMCHLANSRLNIPLVNIAMIVLLESRRKDGYYLSEISVVIYDGETWNKVPVCLVSGAAWRATVITISATASRPLMYICTKNGDKIDKGSIELSGK